MNLTSTTRFRLSLALAAVVLIAGAMWLAMNRADQRLRANLLQQARMIAMSLNQQQVAVLQGAATDLESSSYQQLKEQLIRFRHTSPQCRFLYLMSLRPDKTILIQIDSEPADSKDYSPPGQNYGEAPRELHAVFATGREAVKGPYRDRWGTWVSAFVPLAKQETGGRPIVLGMDIDARDWQGNVVFHAALPTVLGVIAVLLGLLASALYRSNSDIRKREAERNALLRQMINAFAIFDSVFDAHGEFVSYRFVDINDAYARITGVKRDEVLGKTVHEVWPETEPSWIKAYGEVAVTGVPHEFDMYHKPTAKLYHCCVYRPGAGRDRFCVIFEDITERRSSEEKVRELLAESNQARQALLGIIEDASRAEAHLKRLVTAIEQAAEIIVVTDAQGLVQYVNPAFETVTGYTREEIIGMNPRLLKSGLQSQEFYEQLWATIISGKTWKGRFINKRKDGSLYTEDATISPVRDNAGQIVNFVAVKRDITEHLRLSEQLQQTQKLESVGRLAGGVAHDFNNILQVILGTAEMAKDQPGLVEPILSDLEEIRKEARRAADLTRQLLAFARKQTITPKALDLNETIGTMLKMLRRLIGEDITLSWEPGAELWTVKMDTGQVDQILANLCVNSRDAIAGVGKITIETDNVTLDAAYCALHPGASSGPCVRITVRDNGCGMSKNVIDHIFEPFFTTKEIGKGTGLGLATVYGIVKQNGGWIDLSSEPGQGATFRVYLPRMMEETAEPSDANEPPELPGGHETILLVEDEEPVRITTSRILKQLGYFVLVAEAPADGERLAAEHPGKIHLLITDVIMPKMNGRDLANRLMSQYPHLKCLFMSGYTANVIAHRGILDVGVNFIQKPFPRTALAAKVREVLDDQRITRIVHKLEGASDPI